MIAGTDTLSTMLVKMTIGVWKIRIHRYIRGKPNGKLIWKSIQDGPTPHPMVTDPPPANSTVMPAPRKKLDSEFNDEENKLEMADTQAEIILSQGLPRHIFNNLNQTSTAKEIWDNIEMLMQGSGRTIQQRKEDLFDEYERFRAIGNESIHDYFVRFHKLVNDMKITQLNIPTHQMNTKFVNNLPAYWGKSTLISKLENMQNELSRNRSSLQVLLIHWPMLITPPFLQPVLSSASTSSPQTYCSTSSNSRTHATVHDGHIVTEPIQRKAPDVDEAQCCCPLSWPICHPISETNVQVNEVHSNDNQIFDNVDYQIQEMHQEEHLDSDAETEIDDNTIPYHQYLLDTEAQNVPTERAQPVLYDADTLLHPTHHPVSIWDSEEVLVHQVVSMKKMNEKPGHVRPANGFYDKLNALKFVPQQELSREQAYWLPANERASQTSNPNSPVTPFVRKSRPPSQVLTSLRNVNAVFPQFEGIIKERTTQKPDYVSEWCFDYAKQFVEQQLVPFYDHFKKHIQAANETFFKEIREFEQIFDELEAEYEQCVLDNKNLTIEKKNLLIKNDCLIAVCLEKDICSIVLTSDIVVPPSSNCLCEDLRSACVREHTKVT
ncbi:hypothetical protein Tco_0881357 [Tanacetum coccineum]